MRKEQYKESMTILTLLLEADPLNLLLNLLDYFLRTRMNV
jgi:hypothetical protein